MERLNHRMIRGREVGKIRGKCSLLNNKEEERGGG